jgi:hypothetical protein
VPTTPADRRRLGGRRVLGVAVVVAVAVGLIGWLAIGGADRQGVRQVAGPPDCPADPGPLPPQRDGLDRHLVPVLPLPIGPVGATVCRYPALADRAGDAVGGAVLDASRTAEVAGRLDDGGVLVPPGGGGDCPADDGSALMVTFRYAQGPQVRVTVHPSGCRRITNGVRTQEGRPDLVSELDALISAR